MGQVKSPAILVKSSLDGLSLGELRQELKNTIGQNSDDAGLEADLIVEKFLALERHEILSSPTLLLEGEFLKKANDARIAAQKRAKHIPLAYILGRKWFYKKQFVINEHTFIPRPDTEILVELAVKLLKKRIESFSSEAKHHKRQIRVLDICTGSGAIAISLAEELSELFSSMSEDNDGFKVVAVDISENALEVAKGNDSNSLVNFIQADASKKNEMLVLKDKYTSFDLILSNPPYIPEPESSSWQVELNYEPRQALTSGRDGMSLYSSIFSYIDKLITPKSCKPYFIGEIHPNNKALYEKLAEKHGLNISFINGLAKEDRFLQLE